MEKSNTFDKVINPFEKGKTVLGWKMKFTEIQGMISLHAKGKLPS